MVYIDNKIKDGYAFPASHEATPEGLLAVGGDLSRERLLTAYSQGIFPWYNEGESILWWSPDPRTVLFPGSVKISRSLRKTLKNSGLVITMDRVFESVISECAIRRGDDRSWITKDMSSAYCDLYTHGDAHSVEVWRKNILVGGLYGVVLGTIFFGESMFSRVNNASKVALVGLDWILQKKGFRLIDCQISSTHLLSLGAENIRRDHFLTEVKKGVLATVPEKQWQLNIPAEMLA
jgi:leucyl/phenylalanyl-tRNA--protein transferase